MVEVLTPKKLANTQIRAFVSQKITYWTFTSIELPTCILLLWLCNTRLLHFFWPSTTLKSYFPCVVYFINTLLQLSFKESKDITQIARYHIPDTQKHVYKSFNCFCWKNEINSVHFLCITCPTVSKISEFPHGFSWLRFFSNFLGATASRTIKTDSVRMPYQSPIKEWNDDLKHHLLVSLLYNICLEIVKSSPLSLFILEFYVGKMSPFWRALTV